MKAAVVRGLRWLFTPPRRWRTVGVTCVVVAVIVTLSLTPHEEELTERVANAIAHTDPVPDGPIVTSIPPDCGVSVETLARLVPAPDGHETTNGPDEQQCSWDALSRRVLEIGVVKAHESVPARERVTRAAQIFATSIETTRTGDASSATELRPVRGLGTEAVTWGTKDSDEAHGHVRIWQGNVAVQVDYGGESTPVKAGSAGALRVAAEVAKAMELTVVSTPKVGTASDRGVESVPAACDLLPSRVVDEIAYDDVEGTSEESYLFEAAEDEESVQGGRCTWGLLDVEVEVAPPASPGTGEQVAAREYLCLYLEARSSEPDTKHHEDAEAYTAPLNGLGDEAYLRWQSDGSVGGTVVFRVRDVIVRIKVSGIENEELTRPSALDTAYGAALVAARSLRG